MSYIDKLKIGTEVLVSNGDKFVNKKATVLYIGKIQGQTDEFIGVQLQTPDGTHSGTWNGKQYFKAKQNHGMFAKPKAVKLSDGSPLSNLLDPKKAPTAPVKNVPPKNVPVTKQPQKKIATGTTKVPTNVAKKPSNNQNKLSNQLKQVQIDLQVQNLKQQLEQAKNKIIELETVDYQQQLTAYRTKIRQLQDENRMLKVQQEKIKLKVDENQGQKAKQLQQKIDFFNNQKQFHQKQKAELKKKIQRLEEQLQQYEGNLQQFEKLTFKNQNLQAKNLKLKQQLQALKTQVRNANMLKQGSKSQSNQSDQGQLEQLRQNVKILNQTLSLLEGDLNQEKQKSSALELQIQTLKSKGGDVSKLQKKLKARDQQLEALKSQLQACSDAATFAEKLTLNMLRKDQELKQSTSKLKQYLKKIQNLELQISEARQMIDLQTQQLQTQQQQIQKVLNQKDEKINHITQLNKQISKYKTKISQLQDNNSHIQNIDQTFGDQDLSLKTIVNVDGFRTKYHNSLKSIEILFNKYLQRQMLSSAIKNTVGVQMLNLIQSVPESYSQKFYPDVVKVVIDLKTANDKLYLLFETICTYIKMKNDQFYSKNNSEISHWIILILQQIPLLYGQIKKIQLSITTAQNQQEISDILSNTILKDLIRKIDYYATQILYKFAADNIDPSISIDPFIDPVQDLDKICGHGRKLLYEFETRNKLCVQTMATIHKIHQIILTFKESSEVGQNVEVDTMIQTFLKSLIQYLRECCNNPQIRVKTQTKHYLSGLELIIKIFEQIQLNQSISELGSLYSQTQDIKMLKQTLLTTQFHLKQLINDIKDIVVQNPLTNIKCILSGKFWQNKSKQINTQLSQVQQLMHEKEQLQANLTQAKKKILILQKQIKDRQATKQLYQKRMGQLQLKSQQASSLQNQNKRLQDKIKSYDDSSKILEQQLQNQIKRRKQYEEQVNRLKQKIQNSQLQSLNKNKKEKMNSKISQDEAANLAIFKNVINQCNNLRTHDIKKKILKIKHSPLFFDMNPQTQNQVVIKAGTIRRKTLNVMCELPVLDPRKKSNNYSNQKLLSLQMQANNFKLNLNCEKKKQQIVDLKIGSFFLKKSIQNENLNIDMCHGKLKILNF